MQSETREKIILIITQQSGSETRYDEGEEFKGIRVLPASRFGDGGSYCLNPEEINMAVTAFMNRRFNQKPQTNNNSLDPWKHRSIGMRCKTCMWFAPKETDRSGSPLGRCRRHAPTMNGYPVVFEDDWCGDHKLDENKA
jgi:hypothetical protein